MENISSIPTLSDLLMEVFVINDDVESKRFDGVNTADDLFRRNVAATWIARSSCLEVNWHNYLKKFAKSCFKICLVYINWKIVKSFIWTQNYFYFIVILEQTWSSIKTSSRSIKLKFSLESSKILRDDDIDGLDDVTDCLDDVKEGLDDVTEDLDDVTDDLDDVTDSLDDVRDGLDDVKVGLDEVTDCLEGWIGRNGIFLATFTLVFWKTRT